MFILYKIKLIRVVVYDCFDFIEKCHKYTVEEYQQGHHCEMVASHVVLLRQLRKCRYIHLI